MMYIPKYLETVILPAHISHKYDTHICSHLHIHTDEYIHAKAHIGLCKYIGIFSIYTYEHIHTEE